MQDDTWMIDTVAANTPLPSEMQTVKTHFSYLYDLHLVAYDAAIQGKKPFQFFTVQKLERKGSTLGRVRAVTQIDIARLPSVCPTDEEIVLHDDISNPNAIVVLWVGMRPASVNGEAKPQKTGQKGHLRLQDSTSTSRGD